MRRCIELAELAVANGAQPYGALIVDPKNQTILAEGVNSATMNPIWHGEMAAIQNISSKGINVYAVAPSLELYTSAEPCPMCMSAIYWSRIGKVYYGNTREDAKKIEFDDSFIYSEISKKNEDRSVLMEQISRNEAIEAFEIWNNKTDKTKY